MGECAVLGEYFEFDLSIGPDVPATSDRFLNGLVMFFNYSVITQTAPAFFALLTSALTLLGNISLRIESASNQIVIPP